MHSNDNIMIGNKIIGDNSPAFIVAELSCNHLQDYDLAVKTIHAMRNAGADCVKLQTSKPDSITIECNNEYFRINAGTLWDNTTLFELYQKTYTPWEWHQPLKELTESLGMVFISSPFDFEAVDFLNNLGVSAFKVASFEITDIPLIEYIAKKGKPIIISTGIAELDDIHDAVECCVRSGNTDIILLKCTSAYPTPWDEVNLKGINTLKEKFNLNIGISDHTLGDIVPISAVTLGAKMIEKHFILDRKLGGPDAAFSMEPTEFAEMVRNVRNTEKILGNGEIKISETVGKSRQFVRSLFVVEDIECGEVFTNLNIRSIRPGYGLPPKHIKEVIGKKSKMEIKKGTPLNWEMVE